MDMGSASGEAVPIVLLVSIAELLEDDCFAYEIPGLSNSTTPGSKGYLIFTKSRAGNSAFYLWFSENVRLY